MILFQDVLVSAFPKAGCHSLSTAIAKHSPKLWALRAHTCLDQVGPDLVEGRLIVANVRHPLAWRRSWFAHMMNNPTKLWPYHPDMWVAYRDGVRTWPQCLQWCLDNPDMLMHRRLGPFLKGEHLKADLVIKIEEMQAGMQAIGARLGWRIHKGYSHKNKGALDRHNLRAPQSLVLSYVRAEKSIYSKFEYDPGQWIKESIA